MTDTRDTSAKPVGLWLVGGLLLLLATASASAAEEPIPLTQEGVVTLTLKDANAQVVVESIVINGRYNFVTKGKIEETVTVNLSKVSIQDALDAVTATVGLEYRNQNRIITLYGKDTDSTYTATYKFTAANVGATTGPGVIIRRLVEGGSEVDTAAAAAAGAGQAGGQAPPPQEPAPASGDKSKGRVILDRLNNQIVVTAVPSLHRKIAKLVAELDKKTLEPEGRKARIFELRYITPEFFRKAIAFEIPGFQESQVLLFSEGGAAGSGGGGQAAAPAAPAGGGGGGGGGGAAVSTGDVEMNMKRVLINDTDENLNRIENLLKAIDRPPRQVFLVKLKVGTLGPEQFQILADYLETNNRTHVLSNPKLTVVDGRSATIKTVTKRPYGETTVNQGVSQTQVKFMDVGITLNFSATILPDNTIRLAVAPEVSESTSDVVINNNPVPVVSSTSASTTLLLKNSYTAIIGGILSRNDTKNFRTMPLLGHIPLVGRLFHQHQDADKSVELMITITTKIVDKGDNVIVSKSRGTEAGKYKYFFHDMEQVARRILFIDEVVEY
ncbi:MAG: hypothetical protein HY815_13210 [Candidatus Riflebacteria bacterium]|nr:hypothetical protein [Candidatus Riflebacteria bacterium]